MGLSKSYLKKKGVKIVDAKKLVFECLHCSGSWSVNLLEGGSLPRRYWACPHYKCNLKTDTLRRKQVILGSVIEHLRRNFKPVSQLELQCYHGCHQAVFKGGSIEIDDDQKVIISFHTGFDACLIAKFINSLKNCDSEVLFRSHDLYSRIAEDLIWQEKIFEPALSLTEE